MYDVTVVGGGIIGLSVAKQISEHHPGKKIVLLEKEQSICLLYTSPSPRDRTRSRMPSSA